MGELRQELRQTQNLSPQMIQQLQLLQMNTVQLQEYLQQSIMENPVLELTGTAAVVSAPPAPLRLRPRDEANAAYGDSSPREREIPAGRQGEVFFIDHIRGQLRDAPQLHREIELLLACLTPSGWIEEDPAVLAQQSGLQREKLDRALQMIRAAEPAGVGAADLKDCLLLQLRREEPVDLLACAIVEEHLDTLSRSQLSRIARATHAKLPEVQRACRHIRRLNPRPANGFAGGDVPAYTVPDLVAVREGGAWCVRPEEGFLPRLQISSYYIRLMEQCQEDEVREYLQEKLQQAEGLMLAVHSRRQTLVRCMEAILSLQPEYLEEGHLRPMTLSDAARRAGVHPSTVSRAIRGKYLQTPRGVVALSELFSRQVSGGQGSGLSRQAAKGMLRALMEAEDPAEPLSDQALCSALERQGHTLARRTVAKYREELGFLPASGRRKSS